MVNFCQSIQPPIFNCVDPGPYVGVVWILIFLSGYQDPHENISGPQHW